MTVNLTAVWEMSGSQGKIMLGETIFVNFTFGTTLMFSRGIDYHNILDGAVCGALHCIIIMLLLFMFVLLVCMTWVTAAWRRLPQRVREISQNFTRRENGRPDRSDMTGID